MIRINLLPFRAAKKLENIRMQISVYALSVILMIAVLGFSFMSLSGKIQELRAEQSRLKKELASYSEMLKKMDELNKKRDDLKGKLEVIQGLEAQKAGPVQLFDEIAMAIPVGKLFLRSLSETRGKVTMSGVAKDYDTVALFMTKLENTQTINTVTLGSAKKTTIEDQEVLDFNLICTRKANEKTTEDVKGAKRKSRSKKKR